MSNYQRKLQRAERVRLDRFRKEARRRGLRRAIKFVGVYERVNGRAPGVYDRRKNSLAKHKQRGL